MRKLFCWCAALTATGAIFVGLAAAFVSAHPNSYAGRLAMRAWCGKEQTPIVEQVAQIDPEPEMNDSAVFLGEPAVAQEFHKRLPLGVLAADQTEQNEAEEKEETRLFTNARHNRLPGTILFSEETQEHSTGSSVQPAGSDKTMPPATADREAGEILPATTEGSGPQFMSYCIDEGDAKAEMPYAEEEEETSSRVGQVIYFGNPFICGGPLITAEEWTDFIKGPNVFPLGENEEEDGSKDSKSTRLWPYDWDDTVEATSDSDGPNWLDAIPEWLDVIHDHSRLINLALNLMSFPSSSMRIEPTTNGINIFPTSLNWPRVEVRVGEKLPNGGIDQVTLFLCMFSAESNSKRAK